MGLGPGELALASLPGEVGTFLRVAARDLTEAAEEFTRSAGLLDTWLRAVLFSGVLRVFWSVESTDRVGERTEDDAGVSFESGREPEPNTLFLGVPFIVVLEMVERVLGVLERTELAEE